VLTEALQGLIATLDSLQVRYALIGGLAVIARGVVRATRDVDVMVDYPLSEGPVLANVLRQRGLRATFVKGDFDDPIVGVIRVLWGNPDEAVRCDILFPAKSWQAEAVRRAGAVKFEGLSLRVVETDDLFLLKLQAGGPMDLFDAAQLLALQTEKERAAWKKRAAEIHRSRRFEQCLKFLPEGGEP